MAEKIKNDRFSSAVCFVLMLVMVAGALLNGAGKAYAQKRTAVDQAWKECVASVQERTETAYNLLTVAGRYLSPEDADYAKVAEDLKSLQNAESTGSCVSVTVFKADATALLTKLAAMENVKKDSRDSMYVTQMLPQAVEQCSGIEAISAYNTAADNYNSSLNSFSGFLAGLAGVTRATVFSEN